MYNQKSFYVIFSVNINYMVLFTGALIRDKHSESRNLKEANNQSDRLLLMCVPTYLPVCLPSYLQSEKYIK